MCKVPIIRRYESFFAVLTGILQSALIVALRRADEYRKCACKCSARNRQLRAKRKGVHAICIGEGTQSAYAIGPPKGQRPFKFSCNLSKTTVSRWARLRWTAPMQTVTGMCVRGLDWRVGVGILACRKCTLPDNNDKCAVRPGRDRTGTARGRATLENHARCLRECRRNAAGNACRCTTTRR